MASTAVPQEVQVSACSFVNDILQRALHEAGVPPHLELKALSRDGATILHPGKGQCLVWDFTCFNIRS